MITEPEYKFLRLLRVSASPGKTLTRSQWMNGRDAQNNNYSQLLKSLHEKGRINLTDTKIKILDHD